MEGLAMTLCPQDLSELGADPTVGSVVTLPAICAVANEFLASSRLPPSEARTCDEILVRLIREVRGPVRVALAECLAHVDAGPRLTVSLLAYDADPAVAGPVLRHSPLVCEDDLHAIAALRSARSLCDAHLVAIASRPHLSAWVTDVLVEHGSDAVLRALSQNPTAHLSRLGLCRLGMRAGAQARSCRDGRFSRLGGGRGFRGAGRRDAPTLHDNGLR